MLHKLQFYGSIAILYVLTMGVLGALLQSSHLYGTTADAQSGSSATVASPYRPQDVIRGTPTRIVLPSYDIDLSVDSGQYDTSTKRWTLSDTRAQYAEITARPNTHAGVTFIYGHGTDAVFGKIGTNPPPAGTIVHVYTDNGHVFTYTLQHTANLKPDQTHVFKNALTGSPRLVIQTCTGAFSEWRTMFIFSFKEVR